MANHYTRQIPRSVGGSAARVAALGETVQDSASSGVGGADRAGDGRRQERRGGSRATRHDARDGRQVAAAVSRIRLRWLAGRAATGSATHDWGRRCGAGGGAGLGDDPSRCYALDHTFDGPGGGISAATVSRIWRAFGLKPHRTETFKLSRDPLFIEKVRDIVGLYLHPPERAVVLCVDEKPQIQALERSRPVLPMRGCRSGAPTTTAGTGPRRCLRPWT